MANSILWIVLLFGTLCVQNKATVQAQSNTQEGNSSGQLVTQILETILSGYDKRVRPNYGVQPVDVGVTMYILEMSSFSEIEMEVTWSYYFRQMWDDPRLRFDGLNATISAGMDLINKLWVPDTFFVNEKHRQPLQDMEAFVRISPDGKILVSRRLTSTASCPMDLRFYPMDRQLCTLDIESFSSTMADIRYNWAKGNLSSVGVSNSVSLPELKVLGYKTQLMEINLSSGNYSRLAVEVQFVRSLSYHLLQTYIPAAFFVILSWAVFWINKNATSARVMVAMTCIMASVVLCSLTRWNTPKISYFKAIDVYLGSCLVMVVAALVVLLIIDYFTEPSELTTGEEGTVNKICVKLHINGKNVETFARIGFPLCFLIFNVLYWSWYLWASSVVDNDLILLGI